MKYVLGGVTFKNQTEIKEYVRDVIARASVGVPFEGIEGEVMMDLLRRHPRSVDKVGCGVAFFYVDVDGWGKKALRLRRVDGTDTDFSWVKCVSAPSPLQGVLKAMRHEVDEQCHVVKRRAFAESATVVCPVNGDVVEWRNAHVDHEPPLTFEALTREFASREGLSLSSIETDGHADGEQRKHLRDRDLAERWRRFHASRARLRVISARANLSVARKD